MFVHARNATVKTAEFIKEQSRNKGDTQYFRAPSSPALGIAEKSIMKCHYTPLKQLFHEGILVHHAGTNYSRYYVVNPLGNILYISFAIILIGIHTISVIQ